LASSLTQSLPACVQRVVTRSLWQRNCKLSKRTHTTNKRLEQSQILQASEELLKNQQEQLQQTNAELEEKAELLSLQNQEVERKIARLNKQEWRRRPSNWR